MTVVLLPLGIPAQWMAGCQHSLESETTVFFRPRYYVANAQEVVKLHPLSKKIKIDLDPCSAPAHKLSLRPQRIDY